MIEMQSHRLDRLLHLRYLTDGKRHLICEPYSVDNLHRMADDLDIKRCWFHKGKYPHYDIPKRRKKDIELQCEVISSRRIIEIIISSVQT